jgi:hypothetical protein
MALWFNGTNIPGSGNVTYNGTGCKTVSCNGTQVWKKENVLFNNGDNPSVSGGWSTRTMNLAPGSWNLGSSIYVENISPTSNFGMLVYTNNTFSVPGGSVFSFYISGAGNNTVADSNVSLWYSELYVVFFTTPPSQPMDFAHPTTWIQNTPKHTVWESSGQHIDWTYWWPVNNQTVTYNPVLTDPVHIGFYYSGYDARLSGGLYINNVVLAN